MPRSAHSRRASATSRANGESLVDAAGGAVRGQPHAVELDRDVGDRERDRLAVGDRLAERLALVDVRDHVVEHGLAGADRQRAPAEPPELDAFGHDLAARRRRAARRRELRRPRGPAGRWRRRGCPSPGSGSTLSPARPGLDDEQRRARGPLELGGDDEQLGVGGPRHERLDAVEHVAAAGAARAGLQLERVEQRPRLEQRQRRRRDVRRRRTRAGRWPAGRRRPTG